MIKEIYKSGRGKTAIIICDYCGKEKKKDYSKVKRSKNHYCDRKCFGLAHRNRISVKCSYCGKNKKVKRAELKNKKNFFCNQEHHNKWMSENQIRENCPTYKGGRNKVKGGYIQILNPEHPNATKNGYVLEHRLIMEKHLGRYLYPYEVVHHKNRIRDDNKIENLELKPSQSDHTPQIHQVYIENQKLKQEIKELKLNLVNKY